MAKPMVPQPQANASNFSGREAPAIPVAPSPPVSASTAAPPPVSPGWRQALAVWLAQHKSYPEEARRRGIEGVVLIRFTLDRTGHVIDAVVLRGSGSSLLDDTTLAMLRGATMPAPPSPTSEQTTVSVLVHYALTE